MVENENIYSVLMNILHVFSFASKFIAMKVYLFVVFCEKKRGILYRMIGF